MRIDYAKEFPSGFEAMLSVEQAVRVPREVDYVTAVLAEDMAFGGVRRGVGESRTRDHLHRANDCAARQGPECSAV
jgi:hypothetical protein